MCRRHSKLLNEIQVKAVVASLKCSASSAFPNCMKVRLSTWRCDVYNFVSASLCSLHFVRFTLQSPHFRQSEADGCSRGVVEVRCLVSENVISKWAVSSVSCESSAE
ncbi:hypothetical protein VFPPC_17767 [Pochonia chlamydosporia 170]|uniref:Uncharacterized protein n=1 Tax=Pochonia chlamydosporia 170 TaxID=1380566 RepID=A0A219AQK2_METCM|nr:hypothetical protein VFPPC_17767 [Pochonia chlamydosporia 170]OWT43057.1 hypothetical protein VFPPC_17767 [Pochonia chlamydosporia 170]